MDVSDLPVCSECDGTGKITITEKEQIWDEEDEDYYYNDVDVDVDCNICNGAGVLTTNGTPFSGRLLQKIILKKEARIG